EFELAAGHHIAEVSVANSNCCRPKTVPVEIEPSATEDVQFIRIALETNPGTVTLVGAPANAQLSCPGLGLVSFAGSLKPITLSEAVWTGRCNFIPPDGAPHAHSVTLKAGEDNPIVWPRDGGGG